MKEPLIILVGPSGVGKSSFLDQLLIEDSRLKDIVTYTTRSKRVGETEGEPYHFVAKEKFEELIAEDFFVEYAKVHTNLYGVPKHQIVEAWENHLAVIMDIDVQGAQTIKSKYPQTQGIFILPPSFDALRKRLLSRDGEKPDLEVRLQNAQSEMAIADQFEYQVVNDDFASAYQEIKKIIEEILSQG